jgi:hypothetical protein
MEPNINDDIIQYIISITFITFYVIHFFTSNFSNNNKKWVMLIGGSGILFNEFKIIFYIEIIFFSQNKKFVCISKTLIS